MLNVIYRVDQKPDNFNSLQPLFIVMMYKGDEYIKIVSVFSGVRLLM